MKFIRFIINFLSYILWQLGGLILFSMAIIMISSNMSISEFLEKYYFIFVLSLSMFLIGIILWCFLESTAKKGRLINKLKKIYRKTIRKKPKKDN